MVGFVLKGPTNLRVHPKVKRYKGETVARILEDEIAGDPLRRGYSSLNDRDLLTSLNAKNISRPRVSLTGKEVRDKIVAAEYRTLTPAKKGQILTYLESLNEDQFDPNGLGAVVIDDIFGSASTTVASITAAQTENTSRGVEIGWGVATMKDLRLHTLSRKALRI